MSTFLFLLFQIIQVIWFLVGGGMFRWIFQFGQVMNYIVESQSFVDWHQANHSNQNLFLFKQEPGDTATEILNTIKYVRPGNGYVPKFPMFAKMEVNGKDEHPLYTYLKASKQIFFQTLQFESLLFFQNTSIIIKGYCIFSLLK